MPKLAIISDIHGNLSALKVVMEALEKKRPDEWICLGDIVGYGPNPKECIDIIREKEMHCVLGNHDAGVTKVISKSHFKNPNRKLIELTEDLITKDQLNWLKSLPYAIRRDDWIAVHAKPIYPKKWEYITSAFTARDILSKIDERLCFVGHTHVPALVSHQFGIKQYNNKDKFLVNPGSVGQSRDGNFRASCCFIDTEKEIYENIRLYFELEPVLTGLIKLGFSKTEANRLMYL